MGKYFNIFLYIAPVFLLFFTIVYAQDPTPPIVPIKDITAWKELSKRIRLAEAEEKLLRVSIEKFGSINSLTELNKGFKNGVGNGDGGLAGAQGSEDAYRVFTSISDHEKISSIISKKNLAYENLKASEVKLNIRVNGDSTRPPELMSSVLHDKLVRDLEFLHKKLRRSIAELGALQEMDHILNTPHIAPQAITEFALDSAKKALIGFNNSVKDLKVRFIPQVTVTPPPQSTFNSIRLDAKQRQAMDADIDDSDVPGRKFGRTPTKQPLISPSEKNLLPNEPGRFFPADKDVQDRARPSRLLSVAIPPGFDEFVKNTEAVRTADTLLAGKAISLDERRMLESSIETLHKSRARFIAAYPEAVKLLGALEAVVPPVKVSPPSVVKPVGKPAVVAPKLKLRFKFGR